MPGPGLGSARASAAVAISQAVALDAGAVLPRLPIHLIYNGVDTDLFCPGAGDGPALDAAAGLLAAAPGVLRVGLAGTYARWKGQDVFLDAIACFIRRRPEAAVRFYVIGGSIYDTHGSEFSEAELRVQAQRLGIAARVGFIGFQDHMADVYRALDIVIHASRRPEPFGRTIVEAMACGKPVVVSAAGGAAELFTADVDAIGFPPGDAQALAAAVERLVDSADLRQTLGDHGRRTAVGRFQRDRLGPSLLELYGQLRNETAAPTGTGAGVAEKFTTMSDTSNRERVVTSNGN